MYIYTHAYTYIYTHIHTYTYICLYTVAYTAAVMAKNYMDIRVYNSRTQAGRQEGTCHDAAVHLIELQFASKRCLSHAHQLALTYMHPHIPQTHASIISIANLSMCAHINTPMHHTHPLARSLPPLPPSHSLVHTCTALTGRVSALPYHRHANTKHVSMNTYTLTHV